MGKIQWVVPCRHHPYQRSPIDVVGVTAARKRRDASLLSATPFAMNMPARYRLSRFVAASAASPPTPIPRYESPAVAGRKWYFLW